MEFSLRHRFADWPNPDIPSVAAGVYAIWNLDELLYCGMSGNKIEAAVASKKKRYGLVQRLHSHASGRLSGDQFCVYLANRIIVPTLKTDQLQQFSSGVLTLDKLVKQFIVENLEYQYLVVESAEAAYAVEKEARRGLIFGESPFLNPLK